MKPVWLLSATAACCFLWFGCGSDPAAPGLAGLEQELVVCADGPTVEGVDVSKWDGTVDWDAAAGAGIAFAFIRISDGIAYPDEQFDRNWSEAKRVGVLRGAYQFFRPEVDVDAQVDLFLQKMGTLEDGDLPPVIDVEVADSQTPATVAAGIGHWIDRVSASCGRVPIIYTGLYSWHDYTGSADFTANPLWVAQYGPTCPDIPAPWTHWAFFQYGDHGTVAGVGTNSVDVDRFNGDLDALNAFAQVKVVCGDGVCNGGETSETCPQDCPSCTSIPPEGRIIDEAEVCFEKGGPAAYWHQEAAGYGGSLLWTHTTSNATPDNQATWHLTFDQAGRYRLEAFTQAPFAQSKQAAYQVTHAGASDTVRIDQSAFDGWSIVGEFDFAAGGDQGVFLGDNTGEPNTDQVQIVFDALRLTPVNVGPDAGPADGGPGDGALDDGGAEDGGPSDAGHDGGAGDTGVNLDGGDGGKGSGGCGCQAADGPVGIVGFGIILLLLLRRRG